MRASAPGAALPVVADALGDPVTVDVLADLIIATGVVVAMAGVLGGAENEAHREPVIAGLAFGAVGVVLAEVGAGAVEADLATPAVLVANALGFGLGFHAFAFLALLILSAVCVLLAAGVGFAAAGRGA